MLRHRFLFVFVIDMYYKSEREIEKKNLPKNGPTS